MAPDSVSAVIEMADDKYTADCPLPSVVRAGWRRFLPGESAGAALAAALVSGVGGYGLIRAWNANPLTVQGVTVPLTIGTLGALILTGLAWRISRLWVIGVAAGAYAGWASSTVMAALAGTPYGFGSLNGDAGRLSAMVMHFARNWHPGDWSDPTLPAEYPPLYPMVLGRVAAITGHPGWTLLGKSEAFLMGASVVVGFVLWQRLTHPATALMISVVFPLSLDNPAKANEVLALVVFVPLMLGTFTPPRTAKPWHPVLAGVLTGLMVPWFPNYLMVAFVALLAVIWYGWHISADRRRYLINTAITVGVAFVVASWYIIPLVHVYVTGRVDVTADQYKSLFYASDPLGILSTDGGLFNLLRIVGFVGTMLLLKRAWWAAPLTILTIGVEAVRALILLRFNTSGHGFVLIYSSYLVSYVTLVAGLLVMARLAGLLAQRLRQLPGNVITVRASIVATCAMFIALVGFVTWTEWAPGPRGQADTAGTGLITFSTYAHEELLPNGHRVHYSAAQTIPAFPADAVIGTIRATLGASADPVVLSADQRLFVFQAWRDWLLPAREAASGPTQWDTRAALLRGDAAITNPAAFADATAASRFGPIDAFVLRVRPAGWTWLGVTFSPNSFTDPRFVITHVPDNIVVIVRRPT